jgi:hypothetical protein
VGCAVGGGYLAVGDGCFTVLRLWVCNGKDLCVVIVRHALYGLCRGLIFLVKVVGLCRGWWIWVCSGFV